MTSFVCILSFAKFILISFQGYTLYKAHTSKRGQRDDARRFSDVSSAISAHIAFANITFYVPTTRFAGT